MVAEGPYGFRLRVRAIGLAPDEADEFDRAVSLLALPRRSEHQHAEPTPIAKPPPDSPTASTLLTSWEKRDRVVVHSLARRRAAPAFTRQGTSVAPHRLDRRTRPTPPGRR